MSKKMILVIIDSDYCDYLRMYDYRVPYNKKNKDFRPFVGILLDVNNIEYFAPLSSPKKKHLKMGRTIDRIKIADGELGVINLNNMIPVTKNNYQIIDLNKYDSNIFHDIKYYMMQQKELMWLNRNKDKIILKANKLYNKYITNTINPYIKDRCCDYKLLEEKCIEYNKEIVKM